MMEYEGLSRRELGEIQKLHDEQEWRDVNSEDIKSQLNRIGLSRNASRQEVAMRIKDIEFDRSYA